MAVRIRLARRGRRKKAMFDVVVADGRSPRDGRFIEKIGVYNPLTNPASIDIKEDKAFSWIMNGAQPSDTVRAILSYRGVMLKQHLQKGVVKGALTQEEADKKLADWLKNKEATTAQKQKVLSDSKEEDIKKRKKAESKVKDARSEKIRKKYQVENPETETPVETATSSDNLTPEESSAKTASESSNQEGETKAEENADHSAAEQTDDQRKETPGSGTEQESQNKDS